MPYQYTPDEPMPPVDLIGNTWLHDAAMTYIHMGLAIVALDAGEKAVSSEVHGSGWSFDTVGLTDPAWVHGFWTRYPAWNIGLVTGSGRFTLEPIDLGRRTRFVWQEELTFPWWLGGPVGAYIGGKVVLRAIWNRNLRGLKQLVEQPTD